MKKICWITINKRGSIRTTKTQPSLNWDEVAIRTEIELPDELFRRPRLQASITIPKEAAQPQEITSEVIEDCKEAIKQSTGLEMSIKVIKEEVNESNM